MKDSVHQIFKIIILSGEKNAMKKIFSALLALVFAAGALTVAASADGELQNYSIGAKVEVSSTETADFTGEKAIDGDPTTRWASEYADDQTITVDIGVPLPIGYVKIDWEAAYATDFKVETSSDGTSWTEVANVTGNTSTTTEFEFTAATARFVKITGLKRATEYGFSIYEIFISSAKGALATNTSSAYPSSGTEIPDGSVLINGDRIGLETGWGDNAATGRDAAFDGDINTFFDPLGTGNGYCGIDAGKEMIITKIMIHPRDGQLARFNGATIEGANEEDFSDAEALYFSIEEAGAFEWIDVTDEIESDVNSGYRYFRYINYTNHGDVAEVELYGYAKDGTNPTYGAAAAPVEEAPVVEEPVVEEPVVEEPAVEEPAAEEPAAEETVETPAVAEAPVEEAEAPETFDMGIIAAAAAVVSLAGYAVSKRKH